MSNFKCQISNKSFSLYLNKLAQLEIGNLKLVLLVLFFTITCYLLLVFLPSPIFAQQACKQACDDRLQQCQNDDCINRAPGRDHDNCINDCVQAKDRCINTCNGRPGGGACHAVSAPELVSATTGDQGSVGFNVTFVWNQPEDPDPVAGGCDGKGRNYTVIWGDCPTNTTVYNPATCTEQKGQTKIPAGPERPIKTSTDVTAGTHWWYIHSECNCGASADSEKKIFTTNPFLCLSDKKEEQAVCHQNNYLLPEGVSTYTPKKDAVQQILSAIGAAISHLLFQTPNNPSRMYTQSGSLDQSNTPATVKPPSNNPIENFKDYLGEKAGIYCVNLPDQLHASNADNEAVTKCEKNYEQAYFPVMDGQQIRPITPDGNTSGSTNNNPTTPVNTACQQACFATLDQDQKACDSLTGGAKDNCNNDAVQKKDRCLLAC